MRMFLDPIFNARDEIELGPRVTYHGERRWATKRHEILLQRATIMALVGAVQFGKDMPVGAVAASEDKVVGRYAASDQRLGFGQMHAEMMAVTQTQLAGPYGVPPKSVAVNVEPCDNCQDFLADYRDTDGHRIEEVIFCMSRDEIAQKGLVKPHADDIFLRAARIKLPYKVVQYREPNIAFINNVLFDHVQRDVNTGEVIVDRIGLQQKLGPAFPQLQVLDPHA